MNRLNIERNTKIFVYCPSGIVTGGAELLHQLVDTINKNGGNSYIIYFGVHKHEIPKDYQKYKIQIATKFEDNPNNVAVIYEGYFKKAFEIKAAQLVLWWLSVDNFYLCQTNNLHYKDLFDYNFKLALKVTLRRNAKKIVQIFTGRKTEIIFSLKDILKLNVACNAYQSEYAKDYLLKKKFDNLSPLKDYINDENFEYEIDQNRENIVLYNPKKGFEFTSELIEKSNNLNWVPIINMNRNQVLALMRRSKVYVDFGFHPGKDRLPREAAINGCCIITGKKGSAGFYGDIAISDEYKFNQNKEDIHLIINKIKHLINNYSTCLEEYSMYRNIILNEKNEFENHTCNLFIIDKFKSKNLLIH